MRVADPETHYEIGKLRALHDRTVSTIHRRRGSGLTVALDPEVVYNLDALDALIEYDADPDGAS